MRLFGSAGASFLEVGAVVPTDPEDVTSVVVRSRSRTSQFLLAAPRNGTPAKPDARVSYHGRSGSPRRCSSSSISRPRAEVFAPGHCR